MPGYQSGGAVRGTDFQIGPQATPAWQRIAAQPSPSWGTAISKLGQSWALAHHQKKSAEGKRMANEAQTMKRAGWADALGKGATLRDIAASDSSILGDQEFIKFWDSTRKPQGFEDVLDDQGRPIAQRGPQGRTFAHPLAPKPEAPAAEMFEDVQDPYGRGGVGQRSSTTGKIIGYQGAAPQAPTSDPETPFSDKSATERFMNILSQGDPSSPRYAAAWNRLAQPRVTFDLASGQQISVRPDMGAFRRPAVQAPAGPGGPGPAGPSTGGLTRTQTGPPKFNEMQARAAQAADELGASIGILETLGEDGKPLFHQGTNPVDSINPTSFFKGHDRERYEQSLLGAVQMILRMETGAEAPEHEVKGAMARYAPRPGDESETIQQKMTSLKRRARSASEIAGQPYQAVKSKRIETPAPQSQAPAAPGVEMLAKALAPQGQAQAAPVAAGLGQPMSAPQGQAPFPGLVKALTSQAKAYTAPGMGRAPDASLSQQRVQDYAVLAPGALKRQVAEMAEKLAANPDAYSQAEIDAAKIAYDRAFPGR